MNYIALLLFIVIAEVAGAVGSIFTIAAIPTWYAGLIKPSWNPPSWLFGPVWIILYAMMGIAAFLIWKQRKQLVTQVRLALQVYAIQLALNVFWSILFFGLKQTGFAVIEIILMWLAIVATIILFRKINRWTLVLLLPYLAWVTFASYLNYTIWILNR